MSEKDIRSPRKTVISGFISCFYFHEVRQALGLKECSGTTLEEAIKYYLNEKGIKVGARTNKYARYVNGSALPLKKTLQQIDLIAPGTSSVTSMPIWQALKQNIAHQELFTIFYKQLSPRLHHLFYFEGRYGPSRKEHKTNIIRPLLNSFSLEGLAALIMLHRELTALKKTARILRPVKNAIQSLLFYLSITTSLHYIRETLFTYLSSDLEIFTVNNVITRELYSLRHEGNNSEDPLLIPLEQYRIFLNTPGWEKKDRELKKQIINTYNNHHPSTHKQGYERINDLYQSLDFERL